MESKVCIKCGLYKPLEDFYKHPKTKDGRFGKCKSCTIADSRRNYLEKSSKEGFYARERKRGKEKYLRLGYKNRKQNHKETKNVSKRLHVQGINTKGLEIHHWNYELLLSVFLLPAKAHKLIHKYLIYDEGTKLFFYERKLLRTKEEHREVINEIFRKNEVEYKITEYDRKEIKPRA